MNNPVKAAALVMFSAGKMHRKDRLDLGPKLWCRWTAPCSGLSEF